MTLSSPSPTPPLAQQAETAPATPLQRRLWFLARLSDTAQPLTLSVTVPLPAPVDRRRLQAALTAL
ncbi:MAG: hypothetical protein LDL44_20225, partial [Caenispirillum sp.]|nr:hypothetical protein [Caenispirillum sp.]